MSDRKALNYNYDSCRVCGECLSHCPVVRFSKEQAQKEMERLRAGRPSRLLDRCTSCMACNNFCELDCKPYQLILSRWNQRYKDRGINALIEAILPYTSPNIWEEVRSRFPDDEREAVERWEKAAADPDLLKGSGDILFLGCNQFFDPYITFSNLWGELPALGRPGQLCCGEPLYRLGLLDEAARQAQRIEEYFKDFKNHRLIMFCQAGYNMFKNVLPEKFNVRFPFEVMFLGEWLLEKIKRGEIQRKRTLGMKVTVHDSCHSRQLGKEFRDMNRELIQWTGAQIVEMSRHGDEGLCCGLGGAAGWWGNTVPTLIRALREANSTEAESIVTYCNGCLVTLMLGRTFYPGPPIYLIFELVQMAAGEKPTPRHERRAVQILRSGVSLMLAQGTSLLSRPRRRL
jgi:Fe-S oxidoreductase